MEQIENKKEAVPRKLEINELFAHCDATVKRELYLRPFQLNSNIVREHYWVQKYLEILLEVKEGIEFLRHEAAFPLESKMSGDPYKYFEEKLWTLLEKMKDCEIDYRSEVSDECVKIMKKQQ